MDKLEKALEKARAERQTHLASGAVASGAVASRQKAPPRTQLPSGNLVVADETLEQNRILAHRIKSADADQFRLLRAQVLQNMAQANFKTLAITSPNYGEGKTTTAINLALSIALDVNQTVLLVDLDLRKPCVDKYLGLEPICGLTNYLAGTAALPDCMKRLPFERMTILPAGEVLHASSELLGSPEMSALAQELRTRYPDRLVIYDMPPLLAQDDPLTFLPHVDAVLLVVQDGITKTADVRRSLDILKAANVIGTVLNNRYKVPFIEKL